jgi:hypothetical protein
MFIILFLAIEKNEEKQVRRSKIIEESQSMSNDVINWWNAILDEY